MTRTGFLNARQSGSSINSRWVLPLGHEKLGPIRRAQVPSAMDFVRPLRSVSMSLIAGRGHYDSVMHAVREAKLSLWIATANLKGVMVEDDRWTSRRRRGRTGYRSVLEILSELVGAGVEIRLLHASPPSRPFSAELARQPLLSGRP